MVKKIEVPEGYQQTEIGIIPSDWEVKRYGDIFDFLSTATYSKAELSENDYVHYVHYGDIHTKWNFFLDFNKNILPTVTNEKVKNYHFIKDGDIIMADASEDYEGISKSVEVKNIGQIKAISGLHTFLLRDKNNLIVSGFKAYIFKNKIVKNQFDRLATGLKVYGVSKSNLKTVLIPLPPTKSEQTAIATALSDADELIENLEKLIAKKRNIKQGVMQELLTGKKRLAGFNGKWEEKKLGDVADILKGSGLSKTKLNPSGNKSCILYGELFTTYDRVIKNVKSRTNVDEGIKSKTGDVLIPCSTTTIGIDLAIASALAHDNILLGGDINIIRPKGNSINSIFLSYYLTEVMKYSISELTQGITIIHLYGKDLKTLEIDIPPIDEQTSIATILTDMDDAVEALEQKLHKYRLIKQGMMQVLLTGKIRLL